MPRDAGRLFGTKAPAQGGMRGSLAPTGQRAAAPETRQGALDAYAAYVGGQSFATPQAPPKGKYGGFKTQSQLYTAIQGGAQQAADSATQYADQLRGKANDFGRKTSDEAALRQREAQQAWYAAQQKRGDELKAKGEAARASIADGYKIADQEWLKGFDPERARDFGAMSRGNQAASQRYAGMAGLDTVDVGKPENYAGDQYDQYVSKMATQFADQSATPDVMASRRGRADDGSGMFGSGIRQAGDAAAARLGQGVPGSGLKGLLDTPGRMGATLGTPASVEDNAGFSMADYSKELQDAVNPRLEAARTDRDSADAIASTPVSEYAQMIATNQYGLDPNLAFGQFDEGLDNSRFKEERDAGSIAQAGMLYSEYQSALAREEAAARAAGKEKEEEAQTQAQLDAQYEELGQLVYQSTGQDANDLSDAANLPIEALGQVIATPDYQSADATLSDALSNRDTATFDSTMGNLASYDPVLFRVLAAQYADYVDSGFDPLDETTWRQG